MRKKILPFVTTYHPALQNLKNILMSKWHLIQDQPLLREIYNEPPIISYNRAKSLGDILVRVKLWGHVSHYHELMSRVWPVNTFHFAIDPMLEFEPVKQIMFILRKVLSSSSHLIVKLDWNRIPPWKSKDFLRVTDPTSSDMLSRCYKTFYVALIL